MIDFEDFVQSFVTKLCTFGVSASTWYPQTLQCTCRSHKVELFFNFKLRLIIVTCINNTYIYIIITLTVSYVLLLSHITVSYGCTSSSFQVSPRWQVQLLNSSGTPNALMPQKVSELAEALKAMGWMGDCGKVVPGENGTPLTKQPFRGLIRILMTLNIFC